MTRKNEYEIFEDDAKTKYNEDYYIRVLNKERYILLYDEIEQLSADILVTKIKAMNILDPKAPITVEIDSPGGNVAAGIAIMNAIEQSKAPITTIITSEACSMGAMISIVGQHRKMYYNAFWMQHPISEGQVDYINFIKDRASYLSRLESVMHSTLRKYTKLTDEDILKTQHGELWLGAKEALAKGVVDEIIK